MSNDERHPLADTLDSATEREEMDIGGSIEKYKEIIASGDNSEEAVKIKEQAIARLGKLYSKQQRPEDLKDLLSTIKPFFAYIPKAKTAKLVRKLIDLVGTIPQAVDTQISLCEECIEWTRQEKRTFLRQRLQTRLAALYFEREEYEDALELLEGLIRQVRRLDDKALLVEIHLLESRVQHALQNVPKARAALTAGRTAANAIYCPPLLQAEIDMQAGVLHAEERDYKTAYSYFFEAFEGYHSLDKPEATLCLKYMLLCRIMTNSPEDVHTILSAKNALKYSGPDVEAMRAVATAYKQRSLHAFESALKEYKPQLEDDPIIHGHLAELYDNLLEQHLVRIIEPFSRVQIEHIAHLIGLPRSKIEAKLSQMILDKKFRGILDQGAGCLIVFDEEEQDKVFPYALDTIDNMSHVVESLSSRARTLSSRT